MAKRNGETFVPQREFLRFVLIVLASWIAILLDLFGAGDALRTTSQDSYYDIIAPSLPVIDGKVPSPRTSVVLAVDQDLTALGTNWPMTRAQHAETVEEIADARPAALLVDFVFLGTSPDDDDLVATLGAAADRFPVFVAQPDGDGSIPLDGPTEALYARLVEAGVEMADVALVTDKGQTLATFGETVVAGNKRTPAGLAMRDAWCLVNDCRTLNDRAVPREIVWRAPASCGAKPPGDRCGITYRSVAARAAATAWRFIIPGSGTSLAESGLLPFETYTVEDLREDEAVMDALDGALVYYGGSFRAAADHAPSPVYGSLPGVMAHAALAENYVVWGDRAYKRTLPFGLGKTAYELMLVVLLSGIVIVARMIVFRASLPDLPSERKLIWWSSVASVAAGLLIAATEAVALHTSPEHWLVSPFVIASYGLVAWGDIQHDLITRLRRPLRAVRKWLRPSRRAESE